MECYCYLRKIQDKLADGKTPYERRFGVPFHGPAIPFGAMVEHHPISAEDLSRLHQFGSKSLARYISRLCIVRGENLERRHYCRIHWRIGGDGRIGTPRQKAQCKGSVNATKKWKLHFPNKKFFKEIQMNGMLHPIFKKTQPVMMRKLKVTSGRSQENTFIAITLYQESNCTCRKKKHCLLQRCTSTLTERLIHPGMLWWRKILKITGTWMERKHQLSDAWTGFRRFHLIERKATWWVHMVRGETHKKTKYFSSWRHVARYVDAYVQCIVKRKQNKDGSSRNQNSIMPVTRQLRGIYFIEPDDEEFKLIINAAWRKLELLMPAAMLCKIPIRSSGETHRNIGRRRTTICLCCWCRREHKTKGSRSCTHLSSRSHYCERDKFSESLQSCSQLHSEASSVQKIQMQRQQSRRNGKKLEKIQARQLTKVRNKKEVIDEARNKGIKVHFGHLSS